MDSSICGSCVLVTPARVRPNDICQREVTMAEKILIVDDDRPFRKMLQHILEEEGYEVATAEDGFDGLRKTIEGSPDLVLVDIRMPKMDGLEFTQRIRERSHVPVIIITAKSDETDVVVGLELGADDYIGKPFDPKEVVARVRAQLRRATIYSQETEEAKQIITCDDLTINLTAHEVKVGDRLIHLRPLEFKLLTFLAERYNRVQERDAIREGVWEEDIFIDSRTLDVHIRRLREKIEKDPSNPRHIITVRGFGYKFQ